MVTMTTTAECAINGSVGRTRKVFAKTSKQSSSQQNKENIFLVMTEFMMYTWNSLENKNILFKKRWSKKYQFMKFLVEETKNKRGMHQHFICHVAKIHLHIMLPSCFPLHLLIFLKIKKKKHHLKRKEIKDCANFMRFLV